MVPEVGATLSQEAAEVAVKLVAVAAVNWTVCGLGAVPFTFCTKEREEGVAVIALVTLPVTVNVTGMDAVVAPAVIVIAPWYVPAISPAAFTLMVSVAGVVPLVGLTLSHEAVETAVKLVALVLLNWTVCVGGAVPPSACEKARDEGVAVTALVVLLVTVRVTATVVVAEPAVIVTEP